MALKYVLSLLCIIISLQAADSSEKQVLTNAKECSYFDYSWALLHADEGEHEESFNRFMRVMRSRLKPSFVSEEQLGTEFAIISLARHFKHQLTQNNPNAYHRSIYHKDGPQHLCDIEEYYTFAVQQYGCLLSAVNLGNIARAEEKREEASAWYQCFITEMSDLSSLEQFSLFAIGYPLIFDYPVTTKASTKKLLQLTLEKNDFYVQTFKKLYATNYDEACKILKDEN